MRLEETLPARNLERDPGNPVWGRYSTPAPNLGLPSSGLGTIDVEAMLAYVAISFQLPSWLLWQLYEFPYAVSQPVLTSFLGWVGIGVFALSWIDLSNRRP